METFYLHVCIALNNLILFFVFSEKTIRNLRKDRERAELLANELAQSQSDTHQELKEKNKRFVSLNFRLTKQGPYCNYVCRRVVCE